MTTSNFKSQRPQIKIPSCNIAKALLVQPIEEEKTFKRVLHPYRCMTIVTVSLLDLNSLDIGPILLDLGDRDNKDTILHLGHDPIRVDFLLRSLAGFTQ